MASFKISYVSTVLLSAALVHCGRDKTPEPAAPAPAPATAATVSPPPSEQEPMTPAAGTAGPAAEPAQPPTAAEPAQLSDAEIFKVLDLANAAEVEQGKLAQTKAKNAKVKNFAAMMVQQHGKARDKGMKLSTKLGVTPTDTEVSTQLKSDTESMMASLKSASASDFDRVYMDSQVEAHQKVLAAIDEKLIPSAQDPELKALLQDMRSKVAAHLAQAQQIQSELAAAGEKSGAR